MKKLPPSVLLLTNRCLLFCNRLHLLTLPETICGDTVLPGQPVGRHSGPLVTTRRHLSAVSAGDTASWRHTDGLGPILIKLLCYLPLKIEKLTSNLSSLMLSLGVLGLFLISLPSMLTLELLAMGLIMELTALFILLGVLLKENALPT